MKDNTKRFSDRVEDYVKFRPDYPMEMLPVLVRQAGLQKDWVVADIGSGTGLSSLPFLDFGNTVYGVEPNADMRQAAEALLNDQPRFISVDATAEETTIDTGSIDLIFSGQAFHWFDKTRAKAEFDRILKPAGRMALVWNQRDDQDPFQQAYEALLSGAIEEYREVNHRNIDEAEIAGFFQPKTMHRASLPHRQIFDLEGLKGRLLSSSYCPKNGPVHERLMTGLEQLFQDFQHDGQVPFQYVTHLYWC